MDRLRFDEFVERALYDPTHGFYTTTGSAGRRGDFITSPEVGPLFGAVIARALDTWWTDSGSPDPFIVVEVGAGVGTLARGVLEARPRCSSALRYVMVERSDRLREHHGDHLALTRPPHDAPEVIDASSVPGDGPCFVSMSTMPEESFTGVVLANELLDNFAFRLLERHDLGWSEVVVDITGGSDQIFGPDTVVRETLVDAPADVSTLADELVSDAPVGSRVAIQQEARSWIAAALSVIGRGRLVVIDYATTSREMSRRPWLHWVRTYRGHDRGGVPIDEPGRQDITCEVAVDQMGLDRAPDLDRSQSEFLVAHGIDELVEQGRRVWSERAHLGDLAALKARSRVTEARALQEPDGLGSFRVLEWVVD